MDAYKKKIDGNDLSFHGTDRKKLLSFPFQSARRVEVPEPKKGQKEYDLFTEIYDHEWNQFESAVFDK
jgi:hypothetical protein